MKIWTNQLRSELSVRSCHRPDLTTGHLYGRAAFIHIYMCSLGTKDRLIRTRHQLQGNDIAARTVKNKQGLTVGRKCFSDFPDSSFRPRVITISQCMILIRQSQCFHHQRMYTGIIIGCKTSHIFLQLIFLCKGTEFFLKETTRKEIYKKREPVSTSIWNRLSCLLS